MRNQTDIPNRQPTCSVDAPDRELLATLISTGATATSNSRAQLLVDRLLARFGTIAGLARAHPADLRLVAGIDPATAARLAAAFALAHRSIHEQPPDSIERPADIAAVTAPLLRGRTRERAVVVSCTRRQRVLGCDVISEGSADRALMPVREAIVAVLRRDGMAFAVAHNHPSGNPTPSTDDTEATLHLHRAANATGLTFLGHVVVTDTSWRSVPTHDRSSQSAARQHLQTARFTGSRLRRPRPRS